MFLEEYTRMMMAGTKEDRRGSVVDRRKVYNNIAYQPVGSERISKFNMKYNLEDRRQIKYRRRW